MTSTDKTILGKFCTVIDCEHKTAPIQEEGIPSIRTPNIGNGHLILENVNRVSEETYLAWTRRAIPQYKDLIMAREAPVGNVAIIPKDTKVCLGQRTVLIRVTNDELSANYLNYLLNSFAMKAYLLLLSNGATVEHLNVGDIRNLTLPELPKIDTQKKIAAVLSAYDDLIENNKRRIALLEKMAEEIYREWFVRMRFPGYKETKFEKGLPVDWEQKTIGDICLKVTDGSHLSPEYFPDGKFMASVKDMTSNGFDLSSVKTISETDFEKLVKSDCKPKQNDILIAKDGSYLKHVFVWNHDYEIVILSSIAILRPNLEKVFPFYLSLVLKQGSTKTMMTGYVSGSALPRIILNDFKKMKLLIPTFNLMEKFELIIKPIFDNQILLNLQIEKLEKTRNMLLSRLISGKLAVENLDIKFPPGMREDEEKEELKAEVHKV